MRLYWKVKFSKLIQTQGNAVANSVEIIYPATALIIDWNIDGRVFMVAIRHYGL